MSNSFANSLNGQSAVLYRALRRRSAVTIDELYEKLRPDHPEPNARKRQQRVGAVVAKLNTKLRDRYQRIVPGLPRGTYTIIDFE